MAGVSTPAELSNSAHHGGWVIIIAAIGLALVVLCLAIRAYVRTSSTIADWPDYAFAFAGVWTNIHATVTG